MLTWYSAIRLFANFTRWSVIQAAVTPRRVWVARSRPWRIEFLEALRRGGGNLGHAGYGHLSSPLISRGPAQAGRVPH